MSVDVAVERYRQAVVASKLVEVGGDWQAALAAVRQAEHDLILTLRGAIEGLGPSFAQVLVLDAYERDNLVAHLGLVHEGWFPGNTGDWCGQIRWKIDPAGYSPDRHKPNETPERQAEAVAHWKPRQPIEEDAVYARNTYEEYTDPVTGELLRRRRTT